MKSEKLKIEFCKKHNLTIEQFTGKETVGGDLYLGSVTSIPEGFNPTVGGYLYLGNHMNKLQIVALTYEFYLYYKKQLNKQRHEKITKITKHSNLIRAIRQ